MTDPIDSADRAFADLVSKAQADPSVRGLILHGSRVFEGMATEHSDYDLALIADESEQGQRWQSQKGGGLDLWVARSLAAYRAAVFNGDDTERYITAHVHVLIDRLDGRLTGIVREAATFPDGSRKMLPGMLDAYLNILYRSLKNWRDGRVLEAHLDAAASINLAIWVIFAMHQRVRPPNKYLPWELDRNPLGATPWEIGNLLPRVQRILQNGDPEIQRSLFRDIESTARAGGLGEIVDGWGTDLDLMHGAPRPASTVGSGKPPTGPVSARCADD